MNRFNMAFRRSALALEQASPSIQDRQKSSQQSAFSGQPSLAINSVGNLPHAQAHPSSQFSQRAHSRSFSQDVSNLIFSSPLLLKRTRVLSHVYVGSAQFLL